MAQKPVPNTLAHFVDVTPTPALDHFFLNTSGSIVNYEQSVAAATQAVKSHLGRISQPFSGVKHTDLKAVFETIDLNGTSAGLETVLEEVKELYMQHAVAFHLPEYIAHLNCPVVTPALAAEVIITALNSSLDTWDQSAGGTLIEQKLVQWTCEQIGFPATSDGVFTSGGTQSNLMGVLLARDHYITKKLKHNVTQHGLPAEASRFRIFVSENAHFSIKKNAALLGLGHQAVISVKCDSFYRMNTVLLEDAIQREIALGNIPIAVVGTSGTTDFSSIDPLNEMARIASRHELWFHVDAAYGCGLLLSDHHRDLLNGIERADSVTVDYHKSFFQPVSSSALVLRDKRSFSLITYHADYLNPKENDEDSYPNQVNKSIQTTRRFDALKLWFTLRIIGKKQMGQWFDEIIGLAHQTAAILAKDRNMELLNYPEISAIVFRYHPEGLPYHSVGQMNEYIKKALFKEGKALVAGTKVKGQYYLKFTLLNPATTLEDVKNIISLIKKHGNEYQHLN